MQSTCAPCVSIAYAYRTEPHIAHIRLNNNNARRKKWHRFLIECSRTHVVCQAKGKIESQYSAQHSLLYKLNVACCRFNVIGIRRCLLSQRKAHNYLSMISNAYGVRRARSSVRLSLDFRRRRLDMDDGVCVQMFSFGRLLLLVFVPTIEPNSKQIAIVRMFVEQSSAAENEQQNIRTQKMYQVRFLLLLLLLFCSFPYICERCVFFRAKFGPVQLLSYCDRVLMVWSACGTHTHIHILRVCIVEHVHTAANRAPITRLHGKKTCWEF